MYRDGPASGENISHVCSLRTLGSVGLDLPKGGPGLVGNKLTSVQRGRDGSVQDSALEGGWKPVNAVCSAGSYRVVVLFFYPY